MVERENQKEKRKFREVCLMRGNKGLREKESYEERERKQVRVMKKRKKRFNKCKEIETVRDKDRVKERQD